IAYALDKNFILKALSHGYGKRADGPIVSASPYATENRATYELDLDKAKQLLDEAGLTPDAKGMRFSVIIDQLPGNQFSRTSAEYVRQQLRQIGIDAELRTSADFAS